MIRSNKGSILHRASRDVHVMIGSFKFSSFNSCGINLEYFHITPSFRIWFQMVCLVEFGFFAISDVIRKGFSSNMVFKMLSSIEDGRPDRGLSRRVKPPTSIFGTIWFCYQLSTRFRSIYSLQKFV